MHLPTIFYSAYYNFAKAVTHLIYSAFIKNVFIVMSGTIVAQIIGVAFIPIISRLFTPTDFGIFGSFNALLNFVAAGITLEYSQALMLPKDKNEAFHLFLISCIATLCVVCLSVVVCIFVPNLLLKIIKVTNYWVLVLLVISILFAGFNTSLQAWCIRTKAFKQISTSPIIRSFTSNGLQLGFGYFKSGASGLIISGIAADVFVSINLLKVVLSDLKNNYHKIKWERIKQLAKEYRDFPLYSASQNVANALSSGLPVLLLTYYFGIAISGAYAFSIKILQAPMAIITSALRQVLFQKASETEHNSGSLSTLYLRTTAGLFVIGIFPTLIIMIWAPQAFAFIFGKQWYVSGKYARSLIVWMLFVFCNVPAALFARIIRIQRTVFIYEMILLTLRTSVLVIGGLCLTALQSITLFSVVGAFMNLILILLVGYKVMRKEKEISWTQLSSVLTKEQ